jgi:hypothetical protein
MKFVYTPVKGGKTLADPIDIVDLAKTFAELGLVAIRYIESLKTWGKGKDVERYIKEINKIIANSRILVRSLISYRLLNLHTTQVSDECKDINVKYYLLEKQMLTPRVMATILKKDCDETINYFKQNLSRFRTDSLDQSQVLLVTSILTRISDLLTAARTNLDNCNFEHFLEDNINLSKECSSLRGETYFAIDKLGEEFGKIGEGHVE